MEQLYKTKPTIDYYIIYRYNEKNKYLCQFCLIFVAQNFDGFTHRPTLYASIFIKVTMVSNQMQKLSSNF